VNLQILIDKEQAILRKNTLLALEGGREKIDKISNDIDKRVDFLLCPSCFWCASYFNLREVSIIRCPMCHNNRIDQLPVLMESDLAILIKVWHEAAELNVINAVP
jgi:predicted Zn-ribbon and HTH transcriptional regulator